MITAQDINNIIGITESYELPNELLYLLFTDRKNEIFAQFLELQNDLSFDWFTDYFQENLQEIEERIELERQAKEWFLEKMLTVIGENDDE